jgi:hypothetical protein
LGAGCDGRGGVAALVAPTNDADADGEIVWSWRPGADAKFAMFVDEHASDGGKTADPRGEYV